MLAFAHSFRIDIHEQGENYVLTVELPGLTKDNISVKLEGEALVVSGEVTKEAEEKKDPGVVVKERWSGKFLRTIPLPKGTEVRLSWTVTTSCCS